MRNSTLIRAGIESFEALKDESWFYMSASALAKEYHLGKIRGYFFSNDGGDNDSVFLIGTTSVLECKIINTEQKTRTPRLLVTQVLPLTDFD